MAKMPNEKSPRKRGFLFAGQGLAETYIQLDVTPAKAGADPEIFLFTSIVR